MRGRGLGFIVAGGLLGAALGAQVDDRFGGPGHLDPVAWPGLSPSTVVANGTLTLGSPPGESRDELRPADARSLGEISVLLAPESPPLALHLPAPEGGEGLELRLGVETWALGSEAATSRGAGPVHVRLADGRASLETPDGITELGRVGTGSVHLVGVFGEPRLRSLSLTGVDGEAVADEVFSTNRSRLLTVVVGLLVGLLAGLGGGAGLFWGLGTVLLAGLPTAAWAALAESLRLVQAPTWMLARGALLLALGPVLAAALMRTGVLVADPTRGDTDRAALGAWTAVALAVSLVLGARIGWLWWPVIFVFLVSSAWFFRRAGLLRRDWLFRDLPALGVALIPGGILLTPVWRFLTVAANVRPLIKAAPRPASDQLFLQVPLVLLAAELALRSAAVPEVGLGANFLAGAVLSPPTADLFEGRSLKPDIEIVSSGLEYSTIVRTNEVGLRGPPLPEEGRSAGERPLRILTVGDSFTLAMEVDEDQSFTHRLAELWGADRPGGAIGWSGGVPDFSTFEAARALPRMSGDVRPDLVILGFYLGNDPLDNALEETGGPDIATRPPPSSLQIFRERALAFGANSVLFSQLSVLTVMAQGPEEDVVRDHRDEVRVSVEPAFLEERLEPTKRALAEFSAACERDRLTCVVGLIPPSFVVHSERAPATFEAFDIDPATADPARVAKMLADAAPSALTVVDLADPLRAASDDKLYYSYDVHWTPAGHEVAARHYASVLAPLVANVSGSSSARERSGGGRSPRRAQQPRSGQQPRGGQQHQPGQPPKGSRDAP